MRIRVIENLDDWYILKLAIIEKNYRLYSMQYRWTESEGFHAWFFKDNKNVEVVTHCKEVQDDIIGSELT
jgi:hypothetical protein